VFALVDVMIEVGGIEFGILGIQARRESDGQTSIRLPTYKDGNGSWRAAVSLPAEMKQPICDAVLGFLVDEGLARQRDVNKQ
jgi:stage V sporulation protein G